MKVRLLGRFFERSASVSRVEKDTWNQSTWRKVGRRDIATSLFSVSMKRNDALFPSGTDFTGENCLSYSLNSSPMVTT